jgi:hypothetical protein
MGHFSGTQRLSAAGMQAMHQPPIETNSSYVMGWELDSSDRVPSIEHSRALETFYARVIRLPEQEYGLAVLGKQNGLINLLTFEQRSDFEQKAQIQKMGIRSGDSA